MHTRALDLLFTCISVLPHGPAVPDRVFFGCRDRPPVLGRDAPGGSPQPVMGGSCG